MNIVCYSEAEIYKNKKSKKKYKIYVKESPFGGEQEHVKSLSVNLPFKYKMNKFFKKGA